MTREDAFRQWMEDRRIPHTCDHGFYSCSGCGARSGEQHTLACPHKDNKLPDEGWLEMASVESKPEEYGKPVKKKKAEVKPVEVTAISDRAFENLDLYEAKDTEETFCRKCSGVVKVIKARGMDQAVACGKCGYVYKVTWDTKKCGICNKTRMEGCEHTAENYNDCDECHSDEFEISCFECRIDDLMDGDNLEMERICFYCKRTEDNGCNCDDEDNEETNGGDVCEICDRQNPEMECEGCRHE